jgi:hypothetical protein
MRIIFLAQLDDVENLSASSTLNISANNLALIMSARLPRSQRLPSAPLSTAANSGDAKHAEESCNAAAGSASGGTGLSRTPGLALSCPGIVRSQPRAQDPPAAGSRSA